MFYMTHKFFPDTIFVSRFFLAQFFVDFHAPVETHFHNLVIANRRSAGTKRDRPPDRITRASQATD